MTKRILILTFYLFVAGALLCYSASATNSIAGNAGTAGATVVLVGYSTAVTATQTADGSGNYTFSALAAGDYFISPSASGFTFAPYVSKQTIVATNITGVNFTATAFSASGVWTKHDSKNRIPPINSGTGIDGTQGVVLYESNAQILSGTVFKSWFMDGLNLYYAESTDGITWIRHSGAILSGKSWPGIYHFGSTYYLYCTNGVSATAIQVYTSSDGINFTLQNSTAISVGAAGTWDHNFIYQMQVADIVAGTWYGLYTALAQVGSNYTLNVGLATSTDGITWSKSGTDPVIFNASAPSNVKKIGGVYYTWYNSTPFVQGVGGGVIGGG